MQTSQPVKGVVHATLFRSPTKIPSEYIEKIAERDLDHCRCRTLCWPSWPWTMRGSLCPLNFLLRRLNLCLIVALVLSAAGEDDNVTAGSAAYVAPREAYVSLLYGNYYLLPVRVMMRSLLDHNPDVAQGLRARVVVVTGDTAAESVARLEADGIQVLNIGTVESPYMTKQKVASRFSAVMTKLAAFNLDKFDKVVFIDADALVIGDISELFLCGSFCAAFINPCYFNSGLMVITPSKQTYHDMMQRLPRLDSYDGGDQGFFNSFYPHMLSAPMFDPNLSHANISRDRPQFSRLPISFHADHSAFYPAFRWDHSESRCAGPAREIEWLGPTIFKPWLWYTYAFADLSWSWHKYRAMLDNPLSQGERTESNAYLIILSCYILLLPFLSLLGLKNYIASFACVMKLRVFVCRLLVSNIPKKSPFTSVHRRYSMLLPIFLTYMVWCIAFFLSILVVPPRISPSIAIFTFVHVRATTTFMLLAVVLGSFGCCAQRRVRGCAKRDHSEMAPHANRLDNAEILSPLSRIMLECMLWSLLDALYIVFHLWLMWNIKFSSWMSRVTYYAGYVSSQLFLAFVMMVRACVLWLTFASMLPVISI